MDKNRALEIIEELKSGTDVSANDVLEAMQFLSNRICELEDKELSLKKWLDEEYDMYTKHIYSPEAYTIKMVQLFLEKYDERRNNC